jgi:hypothetical protein
MGGGLSLLPSPYPHTSLALPTQLQNSLTTNSTKYRIQKLMYIKLPMYLFFYMALGLNDFDAGKSIGRGGP